MGQSIDSCSRASSGSSTHPHQRSHGRPTPVYDWQAGKVHVPLNHDPSSPTWTLAACGDWVPRIAQQTRMAADPRACFGDVLPVLEEADLSIVNLECVLSAPNLAPIVKDGPPLRAPVDAVNELASVPFHLACLANNHIYDYGDAGLYATLDALSGAQIHSVGAGMSSAAAEQEAFFERGSVQIAVINIAEGEEASAIGKPGAATLDLVRLSRRLTELREQADVIVVVVHAGCEFVPVPMPHIREGYKILADAGADLVIGHHPHVPQGLELHNGTPIIYSLGNFTLHMNGPIENLRVGCLARVRFCGASMHSVEIIPFSIHPTEVRLLTDAPLTQFRLDFEQLSVIATDDEKLACIWDAYADRWLVLRGVPELTSAAVMLAGRKPVLQSLLAAELLRDTGGQKRRRLVHRLLQPMARRMHADKVTIPTSAMSTSPAHRHSAAVLRNRFCTESHRQIYQLALQRVMNGTHGNAPAWAYGLIDEWCGLR